MAILGLSPRDEGRLRRLLAAFEAGTLTNRPQQQSRQIPDASRRLQAANWTNYDIPKYSVVSVNGPTLGDPDAGATGSVTPWGDDLGLSAFPADPTDPPAIMPVLSVRKNPSNRIESYGQYSTYGSGGQNILAVTLADLPARTTSLPTTGPVQIDGWAPAWFVSDPEPAGGIPLSQALPVPGQFYWKLTNRNGHRVLFSDFLTSDFIETYYAGDPFIGAGQGRWGLVLLNNWTYRKPLVRFTLLEPLGASTASAAARITTEYGMGKLRSGGYRADITVLNFFKSSGGYQWTNGAGSAGLAMHEDRETYAIVFMEAASTTPTTTTSSTPPPTTTPAPTTAPPTTSPPTTLPPTTAPPTTAPPTTAPPTTAPPTTTAPPPEPEATYSWSEMVGWTLTVQCPVPLNSTEPPFSGTTEGQNEQRPCS